MTKSYQFVICDVLIPISIISKDIESDVFEFVWILFEKFLQGILNLSLVKKVVVVNIEFNQEAVHSLSHSVCKGEILKGEVDVLCDSSALDRLTIGFEKMILFRV